MIGGSTRSACHTEGPQIRQRRLLLLRCRGCPSTANHPESNWETSFCLSARHCAHYGIELACLLSEKCRALSITGRVVGADTRETIVLPPSMAGAWTNVLVCSPNRLSVNP